MKNFDRWFRLTFQELITFMPRGVTAPLGQPPFYTGYSYGVLYDWDQYFEGVLQLYAGFPATYMKNAVRIFLSKQEPSGFIARSILPSGEVNTYRKCFDHVKPFLAQILALSLQLEGPDAIHWLARDTWYDRLKKYLDHWLFAQDKRGKGLSVWRCDGHTGMDNHSERAGSWCPDDSRMYFCEGVDLNAYLVRECEAVALLAGLIGREDDRQRYTDLAQQRAAAMRRDLWDEREGIFYDRHAREDRLLPVKHVGTFAAMWAKVATAAQAQRMVKEHLMNPAEFWRAYPLPAYAATEPGYVAGFIPGESTGCCSWRAHTWIPTNYYAFQGLRNYGFADEARQLAEKTFELFARTPFCEYYVTEAGIGTGLKPFWGWSPLALFMEPEHELGVDATRLEADNPAARTMRRFLIQQYGTGPEGW